MAEEKRQDEGKPLRWQIRSDSLHVLEQVYAMDPFPGAAAHILLLILPPSHSISLLCVFSSNRVALFPMLPLALSLARSLFFFPIGATPTQ